MAEGAYSHTGIFPGILLVSPSSVTMSDHAGGQPRLSWDQASGSGYTRRQLGPALSAEVAAPSMDRKVSCPRVNPLRG